MKFHIAPLVPDRRDVHGLSGYRELIETLRWGLTELGHEVSVRTNGIADGATNIIFGIQMATVALVEELPPDTIVYQLEQMAGVRIDRLKPAYNATARRLHVWDYSERNLEKWHELQPLQQPKVVPIGWAPLLQRIPKREREDIDVLLYGMPGEDRFRILSELCAAGVHCVFACGLYGPARDDLIARAKIVLNVNKYAHSRIFEVVRTSYLLANGKAVVADLHPDTFVEPDLRGAVAFAPLGEITALCLQLLEDPQARRQLEVRGPEIMRRRDIRGILRAALAPPGVT
jgi:hypothetical protein